MKLHSLITFCRLIWTSAPSDRSILEASTRVEKGPEVPESISTLLCRGEHAQGGGDGSLLSRQAPPSARVKCRRISVPASSAPHPQPHASAGLVAGRARRRYHFNFRASVFGAIAVAGTRIRMGWNTPGLAY
jgi:hypothetical protein